MYAFDGDAIDKKFSELLETVEDDALRTAMKSRLKRNAHLVAGAILVDNDDRICLVQEAKGSWGGKWNLPIGHLEPNETTSDGAKREVKEETGYDIELIELLPLQNVFGEHAFRILYIGKVIGGAPDERNETDTSTVGWFTIDEIKQMLKNQELRDPGALHDILLYQKEKRLPLDVISETKWETKE